MYDHYNSGFDYGKRYGAQYGRDDTTMSDLDPLSLEEVRKDLYRFFILEKMATMQKVGRQVFVFMKKWRKYIEKYIENKMSLILCNLLDLPLGMLEFT